MSAVNVLSKPVNAQTNFKANLTSHRGHKATEVNVSADARFDGATWPRVAGDVRPFPSLPTVHDLVSLATSSLQNLDLEGEGGGETEKCKRMFKQLAGWLKEQKIM